MSRTLPMVGALVVGAIFMGVACGGGDEQAATGGDGATTGSGGTGGAPGGAGPGSGGDTASSGSGGAAGGGATPSGCRDAADCPAIEDYPAGCAEAACNADGECEYHAADADNDGFATRQCQSQTPGVSIESTGDDCDDADAEVNPNGWDGPAGDGFSDGCNDGLDQDCSGRVDDGQLLDGTTCVCSPGDIEPCSETPTGQAIEFPALDGQGAPLGRCQLGSQTCLPNGTWGECDGAVEPTQETCDGEDNDCDGVASADDPDGIDIPTWVCDQDGDGHVPALADATIIDTCLRPDTGCDGAFAGWVRDPNPADYDDCDDTDATSHGRADEFCDGVDNDCNGVEDDAALDALVWSYDVDNDGYRLEATPTPTQCAAPDAPPDECLARCDPSTPPCALCPLDGWRGSNTARPDGDCDDDAGAVNPGVGGDPCNGGIDDDCDGTPDPGCDCPNGTQQDCGIDPILHNKGICRLGTQDCINGQWGDCVGEVAPTTEVCGAADNDCDDIPGNLDPSASDQITWACDADGDNFLDDGSSARDGTTGYATEVACLTPTSGCTGGGWQDEDTLPKTDCDDGDGSVNPAAGDPCDYEENDCDGLTDEGATGTDLGLRTTCYADADNDEYAPSGAAVSRICGSCGTNLTSRAPSGSANIDCNDAVATTNPGVSYDDCDGGAGVDDDCDGLFDEGSTSVDHAAAIACYADGDRDGYAVSGASSVWECVTCSTGRTDRVPSGAANIDCNEGVATTYPGAPELCNRIDDNCSSGGGVDTAEDEDNDGYTATGYTGCSGGMPRTDCADNREHVHPGQTMWFTLPFCRIGIPNVNDLTECCTPQGGGLCMLNMAIPDWDWNCSGSDQPIPERDNEHCSADGSDSNWCCITYAGSTACGAPATPLGAGCYNWATFADVVPCH